MFEWMQKYWFILIIVVGVVIIVLFEIKKCSKKFCDMLDKVVLKVLIFGDLVYKVIIVCYSCILFIIFVVGVFLIDVLEFIVGVINNVVYEEVVMKICEDVVIG